MIGKLGCFFLILIFNLFSHKKTPNKHSYNRSKVISQFKIFLNRLKNTKSN